MPLSEHEQRLLEEMERSLYHNDSDFVSTVSSGAGRPSYRAIVLGVLIAVAGIATLVTGVIIRQPIVGIIGFVIMFAGVLITLDPGKRVSGMRGARSSGPGTAPKATRAGFMDRLNERWDKRQNGQD